MLLLCCECVGVEIGLLLYVLLCAVGLCAFVVLCVCCCGLCVVFRFVFRFCALLLHVFVLFIISWWCVIAGVLCCL